MARKSFLSRDSLALLAAFEEALERNDVAAAVALRGRMVALVGRDFAEGINIGAAALMTATGIALRIDPATGLRWLDAPERRKLWEAIPTETAPIWEDFAPEVRPRGRPKTRDRLDALDARMRSVAWEHWRREVHRRTLGSIGARARRDQEGAAHSKLQARRAKKRRPRRPSREHKAIAEVLRIAPRASESMIRRRLELLGIRYKERGFTDRLSRIRKKRRK